MLDSAKKAIKALDFVVICEGYFDALAFHRAGVTNTVAVLGTNLTREHVSKLMPLSKNVILCFDNDEAGIKATLKSIKILIEASFDVAVVKLPEKDPDEVHRKRGSEELRRILSEAIPFENYLAEVYENFRYKYKCWFGKVRQRFEKLGTSPSEEQKNGQVREAHRGCFA